MSSGASPAGRSRPSSHVEAWTWWLSSRRHRSLPQAVALVLPVVLLLALVCATGFGVQSIPAPIAQGKAPAQVHAAYRELPLSFEANLGQVDAPVQYLSRGTGYTLFMTPG